jgi:hypothetical protein
VKRALSRAATVLILAMALLGARPARAAAYLDDWHPYQTYWAVNWNVAVPEGALRSYVSNPGWLGGGFAIQVGVLGRLAVGVDGTWNFLDQTFSSLTIQQPDYTFTGPVYRRLSTFTALGTLRYYLTQTAVQPYVGFGVGGVWVGTQQRVVNRTNSFYTSGLAATGEFGFLFNVAPRIGLLLAGRYQMNLTTFSGVSNPQWISGVAGFAYYY